MPLTGMEKTRLALDWIRKDAQGIVVEYSVDDYPKDWELTPALWERWIVGKLKDAGVPIKGVLKFSGLESGTLLRLDDPADFGRAKWVWVPPAAC